MPSLAEHSTEKGGLVLAVAVAVREHVGSSMRLQASDAQFDRNVANVMLYEQTPALSSSPAECAPRQ